jgi:pimeloyl-ACP methyl ester carboxylesterase
MPVMTIDGVSVAYEVIGDGPGKTWALTPGGRLGRDVAGMRELAAGIAQAGQRVLLWDKPNSGESDVCFKGESETAMHADIMVGLIEALGMAPAIVGGGSAGARTSLLAASRHPKSIAGMGLWWISGGVYGLMNLGMLYCSGSIIAAWNGGMEAVIALPEWAEVLRRNPGNRQRFLDQDPKAFIATMERWMRAYCTRNDDLFPDPDLSDAKLRSLDCPTLIFNNGHSDMNHTRATSDGLAKLLPRVRCIDGPWPDTEWVDFMANRSGPAGFPRWSMLAPDLVAWAAEAVP